MAKGRKLKIFSFFAGCGILDLGFEKAGYDIEFVNEFFKPFQDVSYRITCNNGNQRTLINP